MSDPLKYKIRGVSASKEEVHEAIKHLDKGIFPNAFCKVLPDIVDGDESFCNVMHADTAGTKTSIAYLWWREFDDLDVWKGISQDAIVMNVDDLACVGSTNNIIISSTIGRNKNLISGSVIASIIEGTTDFIEKMREYGCDIHLAGGETADVGDIVRTIDVGITAFSRIKREEVVDIRIRPGNVIVGLSSSGKTLWEDEYNSGIGSNGLTSARHDLLSHDYYRSYRETYDPATPEDYLYQGPYRLAEEISVGEERMQMGKMILSPTRTYLPLLARILPAFRHSIDGIIHCSGGGQTKVSKFMGNVRVIKDNLFETPVLFERIQSASGTPWKEMYQVFNMGHRMEVFTDINTAHRIIEISEEMALDARIIGRVEESDKRELWIETNNGTFSYAS